MVRAGVVHVGGVVRIEYSAAYTKTLVYVLSANEGGHRPRVWRLSVERGAFTIRVHYFMNLFAYFYSENSDVGHFPWTLRTRADIETISKAYTIKAFESLHWFLCEAHFLEG